MSIRVLLSSVLCMSLLIGPVPSFAESAQQTVLITGANRGIGFEFVRQYAELGFRIIATCRNPAKADELNAFVLSSDIQGTVTLSYVTNAYITTSPDVNVELNVIDQGSGVINSGAARSAGTQRSQNSGLEDVGFIDLALFSDINLFVVDGVGIALPESQSDVAPSDRDEIQQVPENIPAEDDEEKRKLLNISTAY